MGKTLAIAGKEIRSGFVTPLAYVIFAGFTLLSGFFFFTLLQQFNISLQQTAMVQDSAPSLNEWVVIPYYHTLEVILIFLVPVLTMRVVAEERRTGTFELLMTSPLSPTQIILGKFLGVFVLLAAMLCLAFIFPLVLIFVGDPEVLPTVIGFLGLVLFAAGLAAMGTCISSTTSSQAIAGVSTLVFLLLFYLIDAPADRLPGELAAVVRFIGPSSHTSALLKGLVQGSDLTYLISLVFVGLFCGNRVIDGLRWR